MGPEYDRQIWGNKAPWERPKWARFLRAQRGTETQAAFLKRLAKWGRPLSAPYLSDLERGNRPINEDWQTVFRDFFGIDPESWEDLSAPRRKPSASSRQRSVRTESGSHPRRSDCSWSSFDPKVC